eukprot:364707-Chlamydomonas_euryale.AAC.17
MLQCFFNAPMLQCFNCQQFVCLHACMPVRLNAGTDTTDVSHRYKAHEGCRAGLFLSSAHAQKRHGCVCPETTMHASACTAAYLPA